MTKHLILGGARSGKSRYAEQSAESCAHQNQQQLIYIATATAGDTEMSSRIKQHQVRRGSQWQLVEEPLDLAGIINAYKEPHYCLLVDCLTLWLTNSLLQGDWASRRSDYLQALALSNATIFFVSNEVGSGVVPMGELSRQFVDEAGSLHQELAKICDKVIFVTAGLPMELK